ncbi:hypothetical protein CIW68_04050 [Enterobacter cloacae]|nr:hypothetical protein CIW68_04050 [Enterobacter cloacae]
MSRGLFPRHLRVKFASFFVHLLIRFQTAPPPCGKGKISFKKFVQFCALLCSYLSVEVLYFYSL